MTSPTRPEPPVDTETIRRIRAMLDASMRAQGSACAERKTRVLRHPDIAERLTRQPLGYTRPDQWSGYIPPATYIGPTGEPPNDSRRRAELMLILIAVDKREQEEAR